MISWTQPASLSGPDSGSAPQTERPLWTAGCFCGGGRPARRGAGSAAGRGGCNDTVSLHPAGEENKEK